MANEQYTPALGAPAQTELTDTPDYNGKSFGKVRKMVLCTQQIWQSDTSGAAGTIVEMQALSEWDDVLGAGTAAEFCLITPYMDKALTMTGGEGNQVDLDGSMYSSGAWAPTSVEGQLEAPTDTVLLAMQELYTYRNLYAMFVNERDEMIHGKNTSVGTNPRLFALMPKSFTVSDPSLDPATGHHMVTLKFQLKPNWWGGAFGTITPVVTGSYLESLINT